MIKTKDMRKLLFDVAFDSIGFGSRSCFAKPKYIFLFIGDGMGMGHVMAAENYNRLVRGSQDNIFMMQFPGCIVCNDIFNKFTDNRLCRCWNGSCLWLQDK